MKIALDASRAVNEKAGIGRYVKELIENLIKDQKNQYKLFFNFVSDYENKKKEAEKFKRENTEIIITKIPGPVKERLLNSRIGFYRVKLKGCDVFLAPTFLDFDISLKMPQVVIIHDLTMFHYPKLNLSDYFQKKTKLAAEKAQKIVTISSSTKNDLIDFLKIDNQKIEVIYPGLNEFPKVVSQLPEGLKPKEYILSVGTLEPRKNLKNLLIAYSELPDKLQEKYPLVIVGGKGWSTDEELKTIGQMKNVRWLGYIGDDVLARLYKDAKVFVYPSLYEGFGFPIIEAMQFGTPVITSNLSSMPEAGGDAAIYIEPKDPKSILSGLQKVLEGKIDETKINKLSKPQAAKFSWEETAKEILDLIV